MHRRVLWSAKGELWSTKHAKGCRTPRRRRHEAVQRFDLPGRDSPAAPGVWMRGAAQMRQRRQCAFAPFAFVAFARHSRGSCSEVRAHGRGVRAAKPPTALLLLALAVALLTACSTPAAPQRQQLTIAWVSKSLGNPVFDHGYNGAKARAAELSAAGPYQVELIAAAPTSADAVEQTRVLDDLITRRVDGIAVSCNDPIACANPIDRAVAAGIPVMTWDSDAPASGRFTFLSIDNYTAGRKAAELLAAALDGQGKVAIITGVPGGLNLEERVAGFREVLAGYPAMRIVAEVATGEDISKGVQGVEEVMQAHPDLAGWFFAGMWPLFADRGAMPQWEAATRAGTLKTVCFDTLPFQLELLRDGYLTALIGQKYWGWGYDSVQILYDRIVHEQEFPGFIDTGMDIVTENNVEAMIRAWETNDFRTPLPPP